MEPLTDADERGSEEYRVMAECVRANEPELPPDELDGVVRSHIAYAKAIREKYADRGPKEREYIVTSHLAYRFGFPEKSRREVEPYVPGYQMTPPLSWFERLVAWMERMKGTADERR